MTYPPEPRWQHIPRSPLTEAHRALAASQADLTLMEAKRDQAIENGAAWKRELDVALANLAVRTAQLRASREQGDLARAELATATAELTEVRQHQEIRADVIRKLNVKLRGIKEALGIVGFAPQPDPAEVIRELLADLERLRAGVGGTDG